MSETPQGTWFGVAQRGILWLCYTGPLAAGQKKVGSQVASKDQSQLPGRNTVGKVRREGS